MKLKRHALSEIFPAMQSAQFAVLKASIETEGLREPVVLLDDQILDGVHRARACEELGVDIRSRPFGKDDGDPVAFVLARNLARRHLNASGRGLVAARLATLKWGGDRTKDQDQNSGLAISEAAQLLNVSTFTVEAGRKVITKGAPELLRAVEQEEIAVSAAASIATLDVVEQKRIALTKDRKERGVQVKRAKVDAKERRERTKAVATDKPFVLKGQKTSTAGADRFYGVAEWERLSETERADIIEAGFEKKASMNPQPSDSIEWARHSLNVVTGCLHACPYCYARDASVKTPYGFAPTFHPRRLSAPGATNLPPEARADMAYRNIFANSMSDLFGKWVPEDWITATIEMARRNPKWNFLVLTKSPQRAAEFEFPDNWWMGTTVDVQSRVATAEKAFGTIKCKTKWLSVEPLLQPLKFAHLELFQWLVIGGASKSQKTPAWIPPLDWLVDLHMAARTAGLRIYYKTNCGMGSELRVREFPWIEPCQRKLPRSFQADR